MLNDPGGRRKYAEPSVMLLSIFLNFYSSQDRVFSVVMPWLFRIWARTFCHCRWSTLINSATRLRVGSSLVKENKEMPFSEQMLTNWRSTNRLRAIPQSIRPVFKACNTAVRLNRTLGCRPKNNNSSRLQRSSPKFFMKSKSLSSNLLSSTINPRILKINEGSDRVSLDSTAPHLAQALWAGGYQV